MNKLKDSLTKSLQPYSKYIPEINKPTMRTLLKLCVAFLEEKKYSKDGYDKEIAKLSAAHPDAPADYDIYCTIIMTLTETFLKCDLPRKSDDFKDILRELKFQEDCVEDLTKVLMSNHQSLLEDFQEMKIGKPWEKFEYRINISLMESGQQPTIILHFEQEGEKKTLNLNLKQFHQLRASTATALAEIQTLEGKRT